MDLFRGSGVAIVTPFNTDGTVNFDKLGELIEFHIENKTDAIIICGTTGEASTLTDDEQIAAIKYTVDKVNKRIPVIAGAGSNDTNHGVSLSKRAEEVGADGLLSVTPYYNKASRKGLIEHFTAIANSVNIPILLYNVPGRTGINMSPDVVYELSQHKNIVGIKEASGDISQIVRIKHLCGKEFSVYSGNDDVIVPTLAAGGVGVISVIANIMPKETHEMIQNYFDGNIDKAIEMQTSTIELVDSLFLEPNPIPVKVALNKMGMNVGPLKLPLTEMDPSTEKILVDNLKNFNLI